MSITSFSPPSSEQILAQLISNYSAIATSNGFNIGVNPGSEIYIRFSAIAQQQAIFYQIALAQIDARMPDTATGSDLDRVLNQFGLVRKPATSAQGFVQLIGSAPQTLTAGMLLSGPNGLQYQVTTSGVYQPASLALANTGTINTSYVPIAGVNQGSNTDLGAGAVMTWITITSLMQSTAPIVIALTGGSDLETDAQARFRLYQVLQNPPNAGNAQFLINLASNIDPIVQAGFVYPDYNGAGSQMITLIGYQSDGYYIGRDIPHLASDNAVNSISPYSTLYSFNLGTNLVNDTSAILGNLPAVVANQYATVVNTVNNMPSNYTFLMNLPYPIGNPVNGIGGGWVNNYGQTWPVPTLNTPGACQVISVTSPTQITVTSQSTTLGIDTTFDPIPGLTTINWIDRSGGANKGWRIVSSVVQSFTKGVIGGTHNYAITLNTPLVCGIVTTGQTDFYGNTGVALGDYIFPASFNAQNYLNTIMNSYAQLGPGQVTASLNLIALGASRTPSTQSIYSPILGTQFLQALSQNNPEIYSVQQNMISSSVATIPAISIFNNIPPITQPATIFIPQNIAWYDASR
jgi:hypothetical protein